MADPRDEVVRKRAHCAWQIRYHIVFPMKYRKALLNEVVMTIIQEAAAEIAERFPIEMEAIGTDKNHIHLLCSAHPKVAPGPIVQIFKSITAREIFRRRPVVKRVLWGGECWTDGYYVVTGGGMGRLADCRTVCAAVGAVSFECFSSVIPRSLLRGA